MLGTRDYVSKNGFRHVVIGLSGGIDSAVVACVAVDAIGAESVTCVTMPSRFTSDGTYGDAQAIAGALGSELLELAIAGADERLRRAPGRRLRGPRARLAEENLQARIRGNLLMALSNKFGHLVLTTGNKSEMSVGYSTLYGDSAGGFAVIKDVPKTLVYRLARLRNERSGRADPRERDHAPAVRGAAARTRRTPTRSPRTRSSTRSSRLMSSTTSMPSRSPRAATTPATVERVIRLVDLAEYKRRQQPPGVKITTKSFGRDRRMPITNRYRG